MKNRKHPVSSTDGVKNPLGSWSDLQPSFWRQVKALFKKQILIKFRNTSAIVEIIVAFLINLITFLAHHFSKSEIASDQHPILAPVQYQLMIEWFLAYGSDVNVIFKPDKPIVHYLLGNTTMLNLLVHGGMPLPGTDIPIPGAKLKFVNTYDDLEDQIYTTDKNGVGFDWENCDDEDALTHPIIKIYYQTMYGEPYRDFFLDIRDSLTKLRYAEANKNTPDFNPLSLYFTSLTMNTTFMESNIAHPKIVRRMAGMAFAYALIAAITCVIATMPDMEALFQEKDNHVTALSLLMGMSETAFWFTNFCVSFVISLVCYLFCAIIFSFWYGMPGNDFSMILVFFILYIIAEIWFQYFISAFLNSGSSGRGITIVLILVSFFISFIHQFVTLSQNSSSMVLNHILSILPISAFELFVMQGSIASYGNLPLFRWNDMNNSSYLCPPWIPFLWLGIDIVLYFGLFVLFNSIMPRAFGSPPCNIHNCCKSSKANARIEGNDGSLEENEDVVIHVDHLTKIYEGTNEVKAMDDVSFDVQRGEVIVMIGPNGAGKSTLINCISGSLPATSGAISIMGGYDPHNMGVCYQENVIINQLSVREHFELFGAFRGVPLPTLEETIHYFATNMQLTEMLNNRAGDLSGGQKRKLCIGLSLLGNPGIILMDEPTAGVDVQARQLIWKMISNLTETTTIVTSHALEEAEAVSSRLFIVSGGTIPFTGTSTELRQEYKCGYVLRVDRDDGTVGPVLELAKKYIPDSHACDDRKDTIRMPIDKSISKFLYEFLDNQEKLGVNSYSFSVEQLEDMLVKLIEEAEV